MPENKFLTPDIIAREALMILQSNTVMAGLVYRDYEEEFGPSKVGDTITIRKPATFEAKEFSGHTEVQDAKEGRVTLTLEKHLDVTTAVTSKQWTLELDDFSARIIAPAMVALNEKLDRYLCGLYPAFHQVAGVAGSGPNSLAHLAKLDEVMNEAQIPVAGRRVVVGPATKSAMFAIPEVARADSHARHSLLHQIRAHRPGPACQRAGRRLAGRNNQQPGVALGAGRSALLATQAH